MKEKISVWIKKYYYVILLVLPLLTMDAGIRIIGKNIDYHRTGMVFPGILFVVLWIALLVGLTMSFTKRVGRIVYAVFFLFFYIMFLTNCVYYQMTGYFFGFSLLMSADEGSKYIVDTILGTSIFVWFLAVLVLALFVMAEVHFKGREKNSPALAGIVFVVFALLRLLTPLFLGKANSGLEWDTWRNPRNVYNNFNDSNKCMKICGLYEYTVRDFYVTFLKLEEEANPEDIKFLDEYYAGETIHEKNDYTGLLEGKNVIFIQLEGIDDWMLNEDDTPNLYALMNQGLNFTDHYSYYNGGGSTFNSELAVNTGLITPISYNQNAYTFNSNLFVNSMPKMFSEKGYSVNAFHMNTEEYYSRGINYKNWGYDKYYGLIDISDYSDITYELDRELILNEKFNELMFGGSEPFVHYLITYTPHTPFTNGKGVGEYLAEELGISSDMNEEEVARMFAGETDRMIGLLMDELKANDLYDNTVIVAYADHYLYTINDKSVLDKYKETGNNLINHTPFFIWSSDMGELVSDRVIDKTNSQLDILPTVLNLFGFEYVEEYYIGNDIFDENYQGYVFFSDYSWYDGSIYVTGADEYEIINEEGADLSKIDEVNAQISKLVKVNDLTLKYDYLGRYRNE